jgi:uncharacterized protein (TIGR03083 family)
MPPTVGSADGASYRSPNVSADAPRMRRERRGAVSEELKAQLVAAHRAVFDGLLDAVDGLDVARWATATGCPGWDVHDQLAHVVGVERLMLGEPPDDVDLPSDLPHVRNDFGRAIEVAVEARRGVSATELVAEASATFERRLAHLEAMDPAVLAEPLDGPGGMRSKGSQLLRTRVFDMACHEQDIRRALGTLDGFGGPHLEIAVEQVLRAWAKLLPGQVDAPGVVAIEVAGRDRVALDLRDGGLHRGDAGPPVDATIRLDAAALLAVGAGRSDAPGLDDLELEGDRELVGRLLAVGSVTP